MLTRGRPWSSEGHFAAAVDGGDRQQRRRWRARSCRPPASSTLGCRGQLDVIYADSGAARKRRSAERKGLLDRLVDEFHVGGEHKHILQERRTTPCPRFAARAGLRPDDYRRTDSPPRRFSAHGYADQPPRRCADLRLRSRESGFVRDSCASRCSARTRGTSVNRVTK